MMEDKEIIGLMEEEQETALRMSKNGFTVAEITHRLMEERKAYLWKCLSTEVSELLVKNVKEMGE